MLQKADPLALLHDKADSLLSGEIMFYIDHPSFHKRNAHKYFGDEAPAIDFDVRKAEIAWNKIYGQLVLNSAAKKVEKLLLVRKDEIFLFLQYNYARFRIHKLQKLAHRRRLSYLDVERLLKWHKINNDSQRILIVANLGLSIFMWDKCFKGTTDPAIDMVDMSARGNMALMRAINKYDVGRGFRFSTYACHAIFKEMLRYQQVDRRNYVRKKGKKAEGESTITYSYDALLSNDNELKIDDKQHEVVCTKELISNLHNMLENNQADLTEQEDFVIKRRFPLSPAAKVETLKEVGRQVGVTKERIRQIQNKALGKMKAAMVSDLKLADLKSE